MAFTRITADMNNHQSLADEPNIENGLTAEELKKLYDKAANDLKDGINKLIDELEDTTGASFINSEPIHSGDTSENSILAKLKMLYKEIQNVTQGAIPDGSITESKLDTNYSVLLAKRNGELQGNLNAELLGGLKLEDLYRFINGGIVAGTYEGNYTNSTQTQTINVGFKAKAIIILGKNDELGFGGTNAIGLIINNTGYLVSGNDINLLNIELTDSGFVLGRTLNNNTEIYSYVAFR